jgi:hypothetical protein
VVRGPRTTVWETLYYGILVVHNDLYSTFFYLQLVFNDLMIDSLRSKQLSPLVNLINTVVQMVLSILHMHCYQHNGMDSEPFNIN